MIVAFWMGFGLAALLLIGGLPLIRSSSRVAVLILLASGLLCGWELAEFVRAGVQVLTEVIR